MFLLLFFVAVVASVIVVTSHVYINDEFTCLKYSMDDGSTAEINVKIVGTYKRKLLGQDSFRGTIYLTDASGKQIGGQLKNNRFSKIFNDYTAGQLFVYNLNAERYEYLGQLFWNTSQNRFIIQTAESFICYPATEIADINEQLDALNMSPLQ